MGTLLEDVKFEHSEEDTGPVSMSEERQEIEFLKKKNTELVSLLRNCEDSNVRLHNDLDFLSNNNEVLKSKLEASKDKDKSSSEGLLHERIAFLEEIYAKTKVKYKNARRRLREMEKFNNEDSVSFCESIDVDGFDASDNKLMKTSDESRLEIELREMSRKVELLQEKFDSKQSELDECQGLVDLLQENLTEKENFLVSFKLETNCKIDEALQYIKLIENEFKLKSIFPADNVDWQVEEKLEHFPSFIKQIYRDFVNLRSSKKLSDVDAQNNIIEQEDPKPESSSEQNIMNLEEVSRANESNEPAISSPEKPKDVADEKEDSLNSFLKQRKLGFPGLARTISQEPIARKLEMQNTLFEGRRNSMISKEVLMKRRSSLSIKKDILSSFKGENSSNFASFPSVLLQLQENILDQENLEKHFAMFSLALKSDRISLLERVGRSKNYFLF